MYFERRNSHRKKEARKKQKQQFRDSNKIVRSAFGRKSKSLRRSVRPGRKKGSHGVAPRRKKTNRKRLLLDTGGKRSGQASKKRRQSKATSRIFQTPRTSSSSGGILGEEREVTKKIAKAKQKKGSPSYLLKRKRTIKREKNGANAHPQKKERRKSTQEKNPRTENPIVLFEKRGKTREVIEGHVQKFQKWTGKRRTTEKRNRFVYPQQIARNKKGGRKGLIGKKVIDGFSSSRQKGGKTARTRRKSRGDQKGKKGISRSRGVPRDTQHGVQKVVVKKRVREQKGPCFVTQTGRKKCDDPHIDQKRGRPGKKKTARQIGQKRALLLSPREKAIHFIQRKERKRSNLPYSETRRDEPQKRTKGEISKRKRFPVSRERKGIHYTGRRTQAGRILADSQRKEW